MFNKSLPRSPQRFSPVNAVFAMPLLIGPQSVRAAGLVEAAGAHGTTLGALLLGLVGATFLLGANYRLRRRLNEEKRQRMNAETDLRRKHMEFQRHVDNRSHALHQLSFYDPLTELPNRSLLYEHLTHATLDYGREERPFGLLIIDLNGFKAINDTLGHYVGDSLLQEVGARLQKTIGTDAVYYLGGDEFAIMQTLDGGAASVEATAMRIRSALSTPFMAKGLPIAVGASIGIALHPEHSRDADNLLRFAEIAMYCAKRNQSDYALYDRSQRQNTKSNLMLAGELRQALDGEELLLCYQPKVDMASGAVVGLEALVRWRHPREGNMPPENFIALAEKTGLVRPLTLWVINSVLRQCAAWRDLGIELPVAINLSVINLQDPYLERQISELMDAWDLPPSTIEVEITESAAIADPERAIDTLSRLHRLGIAISLDDFGTGYSSMVHLKRLPIDAIKIDKSFVLDMENDPDDAIIVKAIIDLAHNLGLAVVAEGVETRATWQRLQAMQCTTVQGFFISRPMEAEQATAWLTARLRESEARLCPSVA